VYQAAEAEEAGAVEEAVEEWEDDEGAERANAHATATVRTGVGREGTTERDLTPSPTLAPQESETSPPPPPLHLALVRPWTGGRVPVVRAGAAGGSDGTGGMVEGTEWRRGGGGEWVSRRGPVSRLGRESAHERERAVLGRVGRFQPLAPELCLALAMGRHETLGARSGLQALPGELLESIAERAGSWPAPWRRAMVGQGVKNLMGGGVHPPPGPNDAVST